MATTHVFIVDEQTFPVHLKYMFAGIGKTDKDNNGNPVLNSYFDLQTCLNSKAYIGMIQDISRIRIGDEIFFYVCKSQKGEGEFFGVFNVIQDSNEKIPFAFESNNSNESKSITSELNKTLQFRVKISHGTVYEKGVPEIQLLDSFTTKTKAKDLCWSLIYRKLKGARGCTPITELESKKLKEELKRINESKVLELTDGCTLDFRNRKITIAEAITESPVLYHIDLESETGNILRNNISESVLQTYILSSDKILKRFINRNSEITWIGNEVFCSFGNSQIDILIVSKKDNTYVIYPIELKKEPLAPRDKDQILKYKSWCNIHKNSFVPAPVNVAKIKIVPILITKQYTPNARKTAIDNKEKELKQNKIKHYIFDESLNITKI